MASTWEVPVRLFLVKREEEYPEGFLQYMVALCLENPMGIHPDEPKWTDFVLDSAFEEANHRTGWYFQHLPEDKLGEVDDYLDEAAEKLRGDQLYNPECHHRVIASYGNLHLN